MKSQRGGFVLGLVVGLLAGLGIALGVALYVTKMPVPFVNKVPQRSPEQDAAEAQRNRNWDPNAGLASKQPPRIASGAVATPPAERPPVAAPAGPPPTASAPRSPRDPAAILAGTPDAPAAAASTARSTKPGPDPFVYFVQAGAYGRAEDAEQQRARLAMLGMAAKVTEREQAGRTVYRVRVGPFDDRGEAESAQNRLHGSGVDSALVRIER